MRDKTVSHAKARRRKGRTELAAWRLGVMLCLLTWLLSVTLTSVLAQYPTMIPVTEGLLTARPTTQAKRVQEEGMRDEDRRMNEDTFCNLCGSVVEIEQGDRKSLCDLCDSVVEEESGRSDEWLVVSEEGEDSEEKRGWIVLTRSVCIGGMFVGALVGMVVYLWRKTR